MIVQTAAGLLNAWLLAPVWLQIVHLLLADLLWLALVLLSAEVLAEARAGGSLPRLHVSRAEGERVALSAARD